MGARINKLVDKQISDLLSFTDSMTLLDKVLISNNKAHYIGYSEYNNIYECVFENDCGDNLLVQLKEYKKTGDVNEVGVEFMNPVFNEYPIMSKTFNTIKSKLKNFI